MPFLNQFCFCGICHCDHLVIVVLRENGYQLLLSEVCTGIFVFTMAWQLDLNIFIQSVSPSIHIESLTPVRGEVCPILYLIFSVFDFPKITHFLFVLQFPPVNKTDICDIGKATIEVTYITYA